MEDRLVVIGVGQGSVKRKGIDDFIHLVEELPEINYLGRWFSFGG